MNFIIKSKISLVDCIGYKGVILVQYLSCAHLGQGNIYCNVAREIVILSHTFIIHKQIRVSPRLYLLRLEEWGRYQSYRGVI